MVLFVNLLVDIAESPDKMKSRYILCIFAIRFPV